MVSASHTAVDAGSAGDSPAATRLRLNYGRGKQLVISCIVASFATYGSLRRAKSGL